MTDSISVGVWDMEKMRNIKKLEYFATIFSVEINYISNNARDSQFIDSTR